MFHISTRLTMSIVYLMSLLRSKHISKHMWKGLTACPTLL